MKHVYIKFTTNEVKVSWLQGLNAKFKTFASVVDARKFALKTAGKTGIVVDETVTA